MMGKRVNDKGQKRKGKKNNMREEGRTRNENVKKVFEKNICIINIFEGARREVRIMK